jgi:hypothetical protein
MIDFQNGTFKYLNSLADGNTPDMILITQTSFKISVPMNPANRHYAEILRQVEAGTLNIAAAD